MLMELTCHLQSYKSGYTNDGCHALLKFVEASWLGERHAARSGSANLKHCLAYEEYLSCLELAVAQLVMGLSQATEAVYIPEAYLQELVRPDQASEAHALVVRSEAHATSTCLVLHGSERSALLPTSQAAIRRGFNKRPRR